MVSHLLHIPSHANRVHKIHALEMSISKKRRMKEERSQLLSFLGKHIWFIEQMCVFVCVWLMAKIIFPYTQCYWRIYKIWILNSIHEIYIILQSLKKKQTKNRIAFVHVCNSSCLMRRIDRRQIHMHNDTKTYERNKIYDCEIIGETVHWFSYTLFALRQHVEKSSSKSCYKWQIWTIQCLYAKNKEFYEKESKGIVFPEYEDEQKYNFFFWKINVLRIKPAVTNEWI